MLKEAIALNNQPDYDGLAASPARSDLERSLMDLLQHPLPEKDKLAIRLQKKLRKISHNILCFLHYNNVPPDNNGSERAIRTINLNKRYPGAFGLLMVPMVLL